jgi:hypothetical protein
MARVKHQLNTCSFVVPVDCVYHVIRIGQIHMKFTWTIHVPDTKFGFDLEVYNTSPARQISYTLQYWQYSGNEQ